MSTPILSCRSSDRVDAVLATMTIARIRHLPVIENSELKGIVSIGDLVKHRLDERELEASVLRDISRMRAWVGKGLPPDHRLNPTGAIVNPTAQRAARRSCPRRVPPAPAHYKSARFEPVSSSVNLAQDVAVFELAFGGLEHGRIADRPNF
jgi:hypothetical protein